MPDVIVVPSAASVYVQLFTSPTATALLSLNEIQVPSFSLGRDIETYSRAAPLECHLDTLLTNRTALTAPFHIKNFTFSDLKSLEADDVCEANLELNPEHESEGDIFVAFWWSIQLHDSEFTTYPETSWRNHWQPCVYSVPQQPLRSEPFIKLHARHDEYSWFFAMHQEHMAAPFDPLTSIWSPQRIALIKNQDYWRQVTILAPRRLLNGDALYIDVVWTMASDQILNCS
eukprot:m.109661 g.109661  ORF g.109661 m.109661 type:complete len:230 (-) comp15246_c0_seq23:1154-1843(-)